MTASDVIPQVGDIRLEDGRLKFYRGSTIIGQMYVAQDGVVFTDVEVTIASYNDPAKLRLWMRGDNGSRKIGGLSWNYGRSDGRGLEVAYNMGALAEDSPGEYDLRGQIEYYLSKEHNEDPEPVGIMSTAYTLAESGRRFIYAGFRNLKDNLWKFMPSGQTE